MTEAFSDVFSVRQVAEGRFRGEPVGSGFLYGGLTMGMALTAAARTVEAHLEPMSLWCKFLSFGEWGALDVAVEEVSTTRSFATRRLAITQSGKLVAAADMTFHRPEEGVDRQETPLADVGSPDELAPLPAHFGAAGIEPVELRPVRAVDPEALERLHPYWVRSRHPVGEVPALHAAAVAFMSDYLVIRSPFPPGTDEGRGLGSFTLEHTLWFLRPFSAEDWLLFDCLPLTQARGRYLSQGTVRDRSGAMVAAFAQEGFIRPSR